MSDPRHAFYGSARGCAVFLERGGVCGLPADVHPKVVCEACGKTPVAVGKSYGGATYALYECSTGLGRHHYEGHRRLAGVLEDVQFIRFEVCGTWVTPAGRAEYLRARDGATT